MHLKAQLDAAANLPAARPGQRPAVSSPDSPASHQGTWPPWALSMRAQAIPGERGLVETIERTVGPFGSDAFKLWHAATFGPMAGHCNCAALRERWLLEFQYPILTQPPN